jgi:hypothetical protein
MYFRTNMKGNHMETLETLHNPVIQTGLFTQAVVVEDEDSDRCCLISCRELSCSAVRSSRRARKTISGTNRLKCGDTVLACCDNSGDWFIFGVIAQMDECQSPEHIVLDCGVRADLLTHGNGQGLRVTTPAGAILFEYDGASGKSRVYAPEGTLAVTTISGDISFDSSADISFTASGKICLSGQAGISLGTKPDDSIPAQPGSAEQTRCISIKSDSLSLDTDEADMRLGRIRVRGEYFEGALDRIRLTVDRLQTIAGTTVQTMSSFYQTVSGLTQLQTGRLRTLVAGTWHSKSKRVSLRAEEDVRIDGEKIHLG